MLLVDPRTGSVDYAPLLRNLGAIVELVTLDYGDVAFYGSNRAIGIELKKLGDMLNCVVTGRFSGHQLPGLARDYDDVWLIVEGIWRPNPDTGVLEMQRGGKWIAAQLGKRTWMWRDFDAYLNTMEIKGGIRVKRSSSPQETARIVYGLYLWFQNYDGHTSHLARNRAGRDDTLFIRPTFARRVAEDINGIGPDKSLDIVAVFPTVRKMLQADEKSWRKVPGIGKALAKRIVEVWDDAS